MDGAAPTSICPQCGSGTIGSLFCKNCGATLRPITSLVPPDTSASKYPPFSMRKLIFRGIVTTIAVLAMIVFMSDNRASFIAGIVLVAALVIIAFLLGKEILRPQTGEAPNDFPFDALNYDASGGHHAAHNHGCDSPAWHHGSGIGHGWGDFLAAVTVLSVIAIVKIIQDNRNQKPEYTEPQEKNSLTIPRHLR